MIRWIVRALVVLAASALMYLVWLYVDDALNGDEYA